MSKPELNPLPQKSLAPQLVAEFVGTAALLCAVIGSGIMAPAHQWWQRWRGSAGQHVGYGVCTLLY